MKNFQAINYSFRNLQEKNMSFEDVFEKVIHFIKRNPEGKYSLMIGTDSQVHKKSTTFITGIVIQNKGKGSWSCIREVKVPRKMTNLHERISYETTLSEELFSMITQEKKDRIHQIILPHIEKGANFEIEGHIDIGDGRRNKTRIFVQEMVTRIKSMGAEPKIKPYSFVASAYANRYTK